MSIQKGSRLRAPLCAIDEGAAAVSRLGGLMSDLHVVPIDDLREHEETRCCWCQPAVTQEDGDTDIVVVHHSADGRELVEDRELKIVGQLGKDDLDRLRKALTGQLAMIEAALED